MADYIGKVRFPDGEMLSFSYAGTVDMARRKLFRTEIDVAHDQAAVPEFGNAHDEEIVEVIPYFLYGNGAGAFMSRASRTALLITGPVSLWESDAESNLLNDSMYSQRG